MQLLGYYDRFDPLKGYDELMFRSGNVLQSAELNEIQSGIINRVKGIGDALFKDGDVVRDCRIVVNSSTGVVQCESGAIYLSGAVRGMAPATLTVPVTGSVSIGVYLATAVVTEKEDPALLDPASLTRNYQEAGAARKMVITAWGYSGDGQSGDFYPVYSIEDGAILAKEAPPSMDVVTQAIARYDRDSSGGTYAVSGLNVKRLDDLPDGHQVYTVSEGRARVNGYGIDQNAARRLVYDAAPDLRLITSEPHVSSTASAQTFTLAQLPVNDVQQVTITSEATVTLTHGSYVGANDPLPNTSVLELVSVKQGETTYVVGTDCRLTSDSVDWSLTGAEPATGSSYSVTYRYIQNISASVVTDTTITISGAVVGSLVMVTYNQKLPRVDRLALLPTGEFTWFKGVSADWNPQPPTVPNAFLALATIYQTWGSDYVVTNDAVRVVPMQDLARINSRIDYVLGLVAQQRLESSAGLIEAGQKSGIFVDPFLDDSLRDAGITQTAAIIDGELVLPVAFVGTSSRPSSDIRSPVSLSVTVQRYAVQQLARTGDMKINPYMAFAPIPALVTLYPSVDRWTDYQTVWASQITRNITTWSSLGWAMRVTSSTSAEVLDTTNKLLPYLRQISVEFSVDGFGPGETLKSVTFDGVAVTPTVL